MKVTAELPDDLVKQIKLRALDEGLKLKDMLEVLLRQAVAMPRRASKAPRSAVIKMDPVTGVPVIQCRDDAPIGRMTTDEVIALIHKEQEEEDLHRAGISVRR